MSTLSTFTLLLSLPPVLAWIQYSETGTATLTHYTIPRDTVAACGCVPASTHYPTAALSQLAYGSARAYGPACGFCFELTLLNSYTPRPPFFPNVTKSIVVKVTDLCPISGDGWCSATEKKPNKSGRFLNFDLGYPSRAIPDDFFPSNVSLYGYSDFGVWNVSYSVVDCVPNWAGSNDSSALGAVNYLGSESVCCPADPAANRNTTCKSYSDQNRIPPYSHNGAPAISIPWILILSVVSIVIPYLRLV